MNPREIIEEQIKFLKALQNEVISPTEKQNLAWMIVLLAEKLKKISWAENLEKISQKK